MRTESEDGERWIDLLRRIVDIDSGPDASDGAHEVMDLLAEEYTALGFATDRLATGLGPDVLHARRPGPPGAPRLLLLGHADTVFFEGTAARRPFTIHADGRATGPGVADMKAGLVVALAALASTPGDVLDRLSIDVLVNGDEEQGSVFSRPHIERLAADADIALVFEAGRSPNTVVVARRGAQRYRLHVTGRAAHTGSNPESGANAIEAVAHHTLAIQQLGRTLQGSSVTAVLVGGGTRPNIVPDAAFLHVDCRFGDAEAGDRIHQAIVGMEGRGPVAGTETEVEVLDGRPAYVGGPAVTELAAVFAEAAESLGMEFGTTATGGSSDGNFASALGVPTLDGLGAVGTGFHTVDEYIEVDTLLPRARLTAGALERLARSRRFGGSA